MSKPVKDVVGPAAVAVGRTPGLDTRIDEYATHEHLGYKIRPGRPFPFGANHVPGGVNFSIFSRHATSCTLVLFAKGERTPLVEIPFPDSFRVGNVYCMVVFGLDYENIEYGYRMDGPFVPEAGHRFDPSRILLDPYAKAVGGRDVWGAPPDWSDPFPYRGRLIFEDFDWEGDRPLETPIEDLVIYEMHVRSFTAHPSSGLKAARRGTYAGLVDRIPYLDELGVNCIELMPVFEFDEHECGHIDPATGEVLLNYWGYSTVGFFAPKTGYAATGVFGMQADEFKNLVKRCHNSGIEVILDVVFNHTAEGNERGPTLSFRGIDNRTYYMLTPEGYYFNFSGCGNTLNCNNPIVRNLVLDCLRYWVAEYHVDGFRFDLAAILGRDPRGAPLANPPLLETLAFDPVLGKAKLIAEAWDAGGLYQLGSFPAYGRWAEWNGRFRDDIRGFLRGDLGLVGRMGQLLQGSPDLYLGSGRGPTASVNFITCHDGFTLHDLFAYNEKHNERNGEGNRDGGNDNSSWNCGVEGETADPEVLALRRRLIKNAAAILLVSHGVPMILMGDEVARTQRGNNNAYCHDNDLSWFDWRQCEANRELFRFFRHLIAFRRAHPVLRSHEFLRNTDWVGSGLADITWHGTRAWEADWSGTSRTIAFMLCGKHAKGGTAPDSTVYVALNSYWEALPFELPAPPEANRWCLFANTGAAPPDDVCTPGEERPIRNQREFLVGPRSIVILVAKDL